MAPSTPLDVQPLAPSSLPTLARFWSETFPSLPLTDALLRERVFDPAGAHAADNFCVRSDDGELAAITLLVPPTGEEEKIGGIRWFGVRPNLRGNGLGSGLLDWSLEKLASLNVESVSMIATPPYYLRPGVDVRDTAFISWLLRRKFEHYRTNFNMSVDLETLKFPSEGEVFGEDRAGYYVRRAEPKDRKAFVELCMKEWTAGWTAEGLIGLAKDPVSLFVAARRADEKEEIVGFAVYEANQGLGSFGPTGVSPSHRGTGLGKRLLWATLIDMKALGRTRCEIGWVGPVEFYYRSVGATLGPVFWGMKRRVKGEV